MCSWSKKSYQFLCLRNYPPSRISIPIPFDLSGSKPIYLAQNEDEKRRTVWKKKSSRPILPCHCTVPRRLFTFRWRRITVAGRPLSLPLPPSSRWVPLPSSTRRVSPRFASGASSAYNQLGLSANNTGGWLWLNKARNWGYWAII